ncbi:hypothetical protein V8C42DRAFT_322350 [Trichoderma barbatum]
MFSVPFEAPNIVYERRANEAWDQGAPDFLGGAYQLWGIHWDRFNTMQIPILGKKEYFDTAMTIAKASKSKQEFESKFEEINKQRKEMLLATMKHISREIFTKDDIFPCKDAEARASIACATGCLDHFIRLLEGSVFGWEADVVEPDEPITFDENGEEYIGVEFDEDGNCIRFPLECESGGLNFDITYSSFDSPRKRSPEESRDNVIFTGTYAEYLASKSGRKTHGSLDSDKRLASTRKLQALQSSDAFIPDKGGEESGTQDAPRKHLNDPSGDGSSTSTKKRVRFIDGDVDEVAGHQPKRRKLNDSAAPTPTLETAHSIQQSSSGSVTGKRSRPDDGDDDEDNGFKRQKIESLLSSPTPHASSIESAEDMSTNIPPQETPAKSLEAQDTDAIVKGERKRRKRSSASRGPYARPPGNPSTSRSSRRGTSSTLWELDTSGKPHSVS